MKMQIAIFAVVAMLGAQTALAFQCQVHQMGPGGSKTTALRNMNGGVLEGEIDTGKKVQYRVNIFAGNDDVTIDIKENGLRTYILNAAFDSAGELEFHTNQETDVVVLRCSK